MTTLRIAIQKSGRLNEDSLKIIKDCGISIDNGKDQLKASARNFPLEVFYLRNGDIPQYLRDGVVDIAIIGENGIGKTTFLRLLMNEVGYEPSSGEFTWSENVDIGYYAQDHEFEFELDMNLFEWMSQWRQPSDDEQAVRSYLGRLLFSADDINKSVKILSGGEKGRMLFGKLMMQKPNILVLDEPTNHMDMESIESLNMALEQYEGTLLFVSHDREFVSTIATRIIEITKEGYIDFAGTYDEYLASQN